MLTEREKMMIAWGKRQAEKWREATEMPQWEGASKFYLAAANRATIFRGALVNIVEMCDGTASDGTVRALVRTLAAKVLKAEEEDKPDPVTGEIMRRGGKANE
jgi:hypothetical protein